MSVVFYKFKSAKDFDTCTFDGTGISVFDLKHEIMISKKLQKAQDFDLHVSNAQTNEEYENDAYIIPRNTSVLVARLPIPKNSRVNAQRYLNAAVQVLPKQQQRQVYKPTVTTITPGAEQEGISLMFKQQAEQWQQTQDQMAAVRPVYRPPIGVRPGMTPGKGNPMMMEAARPPPPGYTCFRCGEKGHYINMCPTIGNSEYDNKPKIKKATGIPSMFLKTVAKDSEGAMMVTQEGELVQAVPNDDVWQRMHARNGFGNFAADSGYDTAPILPELQCKICQKLLRDAVRAPCCKTLFCDSCINAELNFSEDVTMRFKCPNCRAHLKPDDLKNDTPMRNKVNEHLKQHLKDRKRSGDELESAAKKPKK